MNEDRLYFTQQPYHWIGAEEEIVAKEEMFQDANMIPYEMQNHFLNNFWSNYTTYDPNNNNSSSSNMNDGVISRYTLSRQNVYPQIEAPKSNFYSQYKSHPSYDRFCDASGKTPLLKKMLQAPMSASLEDIRVNSYLPTNYLQNMNQYSMPANEIFNDNNSDTLTADSEGNEYDTWDGYRYNTNNALMPNYYYPKPMQDVTLSGNVVPYQNHMNVQENCRNWLNMNPMNDANKQDRGISATGYDDGQNMTFLTQQDPFDGLENIEGQQMFTDMQGNPCTSYYAQDVTGQGFGYYTQSGSESTNFVLPEQQNYARQDTPTNFVDCEQYGYELKYNTNENDGVTYTVLDDSKAQNSANDNELSSMAAQVQTVEARNDEPLQPYYPTWRSNAVKKLHNLEILFNVRSKSSIDLSRDDLAQVNYCCKTPFMAEKVNAQNAGVQLPSNVLPIENRQHNFNTYALLFHTLNTPETNDTINSVQIAETLRGRRQ